MFFSLNYAFPTGVFVFFAMEINEKPNRLAVFEHVSAKNADSDVKFEFNQKSIDTTLTSECDGLIIDEIYGDEANNLVSF